MREKYTKSFFIYFLFFGIIVEIASMSVDYLFEYIEMKDNLRDRYETEVKIKTKNLECFLSKTKYSINSILENKFFTQYLNNPTKNKEFAENLFLYTLTENSNYMQVRFIDIKGDEKIRIDKDTETRNPVIIAPNKLQNKKNRYYFKEIINTPKDTFWFSDIDLNIERGKVQVPFQPTLRIAKKVVKDGKNLGIIIINMIFKDYLMSLVDSYNFNIFVVDKFGNYIFSLNNKKSWSLNLKTNENLLKDKNLNLKELENMRIDDTFIKSIQDIIKNRQSVFLVFDTKEELVNNILNHNLRASIIVLFIVLILTIPLAFFVSKIPYKLHIELREIGKKAITDPLTKLNNRSKLDESLYRELNLAKRYGREFSIVFVDIDFFKKINDTHGHQIGDMVLIEFADILRKNTRSVDIVGRYGGEEFLIILSDTSKPGAIRLAQKIRIAIENHKFKNKYKITASFGISCFDKNNPSIENLIKNADEALYMAKKNGRNRVEFS